MSKVVRMANVNKAADEIFSKKFRRLEQRLDALIKKVNRLEQQVNTPVVTNPGVIHASSSEGQKDS